MYNFLPQLLFIGSLAGIIVIVGRKLPAVLAEKKKQMSLFEKVASEFPQEERFLRVKIAKYNVMALALLEKTLRRSVILSLKIGNTSTRMIHSLKERSQKVAVPYLDELVSEREDKSFSARESAFIDAIKKDPKNTEAYRGLGNLYLEEGNLRDARLSFAEILKLDSRDREAAKKLKEVEEREENK